MPLAGAITFDVRTIQVVACLTITRKKQLPVLKYSRAVHHLAVHYTVGIIKISKQISANTVALARTITVN